MGPKPKPPVDYIFQKTRAAVLMNVDKKAEPQSLVLKNGAYLTLRHADPDDAERLLCFVDRVAGESENLAFGPGEFELSVEQERAFLQRIAEESGSIYLVAEVAGEIAGTLTFMAGKRPRLQHAGELGLAIARAYWNFGIGSQMLAYLIGWARQNGTIRKINLHVRVDNLPAIHLYEKYGFVHEGRITREFYLHGQFVDVYTMGLQLDPQ